MNKNKKRMLSLTLAAAMAATGITGCGGGNSSTPAGTTPAATPAATTASGSGSTADTSGAAENYFPLSSPITINVAGVRGDGHVPFADCAAFKTLEEETNVKVNWLDWPQSQQKEKRNLAFASGTLPDAFYGSWSLDAPDVVRYGSEGLLLPMNDYLNETYMPNFKYILDNEPGLSAALSTPTGEIYVLPTMNRNALPNTSDTLVINSEWLNTVGKEMPTTTDELFDVLMAFKEAGDLNGNGKADEIPLTFKYGEGNTGLFSLMGFTGLVMNNKNSRMAMKDNTPVFMPATDEYKEYLLYLNKLYENGLLDREAFTMDNPAYNAKTQTSTPVAGVISAWTAEGINNPIPGNDLTKEGVYVYMPPVKDSNSDVEPVWLKRANPLNGNLSFAVNSKTKYAEEILRWIDLAYDKETSITNYIGVEGLNIHHEGGNEYTKIKNAEGKNYSNEELSSEIPCKFAVAYVMEGDLVFTDTIVSPQNKVAADEIYGPYLSKSMVDDSAMSTIEEGERMAIITPDLFSYVDQQTAKFITEGGIEEGWDSYLAQLKNLNVEEYVTIKTAIHNRAIQ